MTDMQNGFNFAYPDSLSISAARGEILAALARRRVVVVCGETGSGKTTQLPKMALESVLSSGRKKPRIACTQPRRLAATALAARVAEELGTPVGELVGWQHRYGKQLSPRTAIKFMTDGVLLAETRFDPLLEAYDAIIVDEVHERTLNVDFLLGILKRILARRNDLKVILASATLDCERFSAFFDGAPVIAVPGRTYPIEYRYRGPEPGDDDEEHRDCDLPSAVVRAVAELPESSDTLVFLPGEQAIRECSEALSRDERFAASEILPLTASLDAAAQRRVFACGTRRRIVLATNVAETSITIPRIRAVVDSGLARISRFVHRTQVQRLQIEPISQASARQRAGRCGRTGPGICIRLYSEADLQARDAYTTPEILRTSLAGVILTLLDLNLGEIDDFPFVEPPTGAMIREGLKELLELGAIARDEACRRTRLTPTGRQLSRINLEPRLARMLIEASRRATLPSALPIVAAMSCDDPRRRPLDERAAADTAHRQFAVAGSDFAGTLKLWQWWSRQRAELSQSKLRQLAKKNYLSFTKMREWTELTRQLDAFCRRLKLDCEHDHGGPDQLTMSLTSGLLGHLGHLDAERHDYRGAHAVRFQLHPSSVLARSRKNSAEWIVAGELVDTSRLYARNAAAIDPAWIEPLAKPLCKYSYRAPEWDPVHGFVRALEQVTLYGLVIVPSRRRDFSRIDPAAAREIFLLHALVRGEIVHPPRRLQKLLQRIEDLRCRAERSRQPMLFDEVLVAERFGAILPPEIVSLPDLSRHLTAHPETLASLERELDRFGASAQPARHDYPDSITIGKTTVSLEYRYAPDDRDCDGITAVVSEDAIPELKGWRADWLVPGARAFKLSAMLGGLAAQYRRALPPPAETVPVILPMLSPNSGETFTEAVRRAILERYAIKIPLIAFEQVRLPPHATMHLRIVDKHGNTVAQSADAAALLRQRLAAVEPAPVEKTAVRPLDAAEKALLKRAAELVHQAGLLADTAVGEDVATQIAWLTFPGWHEKIPSERRSRYPEYLRGIAVRLERASFNARGDASKRERFAPWWTQYADTVLGRGARIVDRAALDDYRWLLEEYRLALFAQEVKTIRPASPERLAALWVRATEPE